MAQLTKNKAHVASPIDYSKVPSKGYYTEAFKKGAEERAEGKRLKKIWKGLIEDEYGQKLSRKEIKRVQNPTNYKLSS